MSKKQKDWVGIWYKIAKKRGGNILNFFAFLDLKTNMLESFFFSHEYMDGAGALCLWLKSKGYQITNPPQAKIKDAPSIFEIFKIFFKAILTKIRKTMTAQSTNINWSEKNIDLINSTGVVEYFYLTQDITKKLMQKLKKEKFSINAFLLEILTKVISENNLVEIKNDEILGDWLFTVNMRGNVKVVNPYFNQSSGIFIPSSSQMSAVTFHMNIKKKLLAKEHWLNWWSLNSSKFFNDKRLEKISRNSSLNNFYLGTFSNIGFWDLKQNNLKSCNENEQIILCCPPGSVNYPISTAIIGWQQKLSFTMKIHPYIMKDQKKTKIITKQIQSKIEHYISS